MAGMPRIPLGRTAPRRGRREPSGTLARRDHCGPLAVYAHGDLGVGLGACVKIGKPQTERTYQAFPRVRGVLKRWR